MLQWLRGGRTKHLKDVSTQAFHQTFVWCWCCNGRGEEGTKRWQPVLARVGGRGEILGMGHSGLIEIATVDRALDLAGGGGGISMVFHESP